MIDDDTVPPMGWHNVDFPVAPGMSYTICISPISGNPDLYGDYDREFFSGLADTADAQHWSRNTGLTPDCLWFDATQSGTYYLGIHGRDLTEKSSFELWRVSAPTVSVPDGFADALAWPLPESCTRLVHRFSSFGAPWGNPAPGNDPFFSEHADSLHGGADIACPPGTPVRSACDGEVVRRGELQARWGGYVVVQCDPQHGTTLTIYYDHVEHDVDVGMRTRAGETELGAIFDMNVAGEDDHLHLAICVGTDEQCTQTEDPVSGVLAREDFPDRLLNPWIGTNPEIWQ